MVTRFRDLSNGDTFDFIDDENPTHNSFFYRCKKLGKRKYGPADGPVEGRVVCTVGTITCKVFHVKKGEQS